ncbi:MAG: HAMP domain-containing protein, partial [Chlorobi bacterium]|nr:HAMP domain-containing protein [Chlorobiota bacterium]
MFVIILILGVITYMNLARVNNEIEELSDMHIPVVSEANKLDRYWREVSEYSRSYDFTGNEYFFLREKKSMKKLFTAYDKLNALFVDEEKGAILKKKSIDLEHLGKLLKKFDDVSNSFAKEYKIVNEKHNELQKENDELYELRKKYLGSYISQRMLAEYFSVFNKIEGGYNDRSVFEIEQTREELERLKERVRVSGIPADLKQAITTAYQVIDDFIIAEKKAMKTELKKFELSKNVMWEIRATSDIGIDEIMAMGQRTSKTVTKQKRILVFSIIIILVIGVLLVFVLSWSISRPLERGIKIAQRVASGDLSVKYEVKGKDEVAQLLDALNRMVDNLRKIVNDISRSAEEISESSEKLNKEALELSEGATQQA